MVPRRGAALGSLFYGVSSVTWLVHVVRGLRLAAPVCKPPEKTDIDVKDSRNLEHVRPQSASE